MLNTLIPTQVPVQNNVPPPASLSHLTTARPDLPDRPVVMPMNIWLKTLVPAPDVTAPQSPLQNNLHACRTHVISQYSQSVQYEQPLDPQHQLIQAIINDTTGELLEYWQLIQQNEYILIWEQTLVNELHCIAQGI